jgi:hypothetical protein
MVMTGSQWANTLVGFIVGLPILYVIYRAFRSLRGAEANVWRALPGSAGANFAIVFALEKPLGEQVPSAEELRAVSVTLPGQRAGLTLGPGQYWLYALPSQGAVSDGDAAGVLSAALAENRASVVAFEDLPVQVA